MIIDNDEERERYVYRERLRERRELDSKQMTA